MIVDYRKKRIELPPSDEQLGVDFASVVGDSAPYRPGVDEGVADNAQVEAVP